MGVQCAGAACALGSRGEMLHSRAMLIHEQVLPWSALATPGKLEKALGKDGPQLMLIDCAWK